MPLDGGQEASALYKTCGSRKCILRQSEMMSADDCMYAIEGDCGVDWEAHFWCTSTTISGTSLADDYYFEISRNCLMQMKLKMKLNCASPVSAEV